jgi:hypothetical protein
MDDRRSDHREASHFSRNTVCSHRVMLDSVSRPLDEPHTLAAEPPNIEVGKVPPSPHSKFLLLAGEPDTGDTDADTLDSVVRSNA